MTNQSDQHVPPPSKSRQRRVLCNLAWVVTGVLLTILMLANPLHLHPVDRWVHGLLGHRPTDEREGGTIAGSPKRAERKLLFYRNPMNPAITSPVPMKDEMGMDYVPVYEDELKAEPKQHLWTCSMHPQVVQDHPGSCPICGMTLVPLRTEPPAATKAPVAGAERKILFYRNPMNPAVTSPVPMKDEMGMDYVPVYESEAAATPGDGASVTIDPSVVQNMNVQVQEVRRQDLTREIRTVGYLGYDQQKMVTVTTKYPGFVEKVYVNYLGEPVRKGQALFEIYSPELVQTEQDLLSALEFARKLKGAPGEAQGRAQALVAATRARFAYWDIRPAQIDRFEKSGEVFRTLTVSAPTSGVVMKRMDGLEGMAVKPGMELFHIADLSSLWLTVEVFEDQLGWLKVGSVADIALSYFPGETFTGRVRFVEPQVSEKTRTVPLRLEVPNPDARLRSGMYATVRFHPVVSKDAIVVPSVAVLRTGERNLVVLAEGEGRFAPRQVTLGSEGDGSTEVLSGLQAGDKVVTSAQFLIDSESNLREAILKMVAAAKKK